MIKQNKHAHDYFDIEFIFKAHIDFKQKRPIIYLTILR